MITANKITTNMPETPRRPACRRYWW